MLLIDDFEIDAEVSSDHSFENDVTDHPVEVGADVTDHSRPKPITVDITGVVSDTPLTNMQSARTGVTLPSDDALVRLIAIRDAREPVRVATKLRTYDNMMLVSLAITKDAQTGRALRFRASFKQVILAKNQRVVKRVVVPRAKDKVDRGNKPATPVAVSPGKLPQVNPYIPATRKVQLEDGSYTPGGKVAVEQDLARKFRSQF
jgi:hypothetical protein